MSSYVVDDSTINKIISFLELRTNKEKYYFPTRQIAEYYNTPSKQGWEQLATDMINLNIRAVNTRYNGTESVRQFQYQLTLNTTTMIVFKALECWLYQCSEGGTVMDELYVLMEEVKNRLACDIVSHLPEYDKAVWG